MFLYSAILSWFNRQFSNQTNAILLALVSTGLFVITGILVRLLNERIDVFQILLFRQLVFLALLTPAIIKTWNALLRPQLVHIHLYRITGAFISLYLGYVTVSNIDLTNATALGFTQTLFVAVIAALFLKEHITFSRIFTITVGFIGVLLVVQPSIGNLSFLYTLSGLAAAFGAAIAVTCVRYISQQQSKTSLLTYQAVFVGLIALPPSLLFWQWPTLYEGCLLLLVGALSALAQTIGVGAYKLGKANIVSNVQYSSILYSLAFGYLLFSEIPNGLAYLGICLILMSPFLSKIIPSRSQKTE